MQALPDQTKTCEDEMFEMEGERVPFPILQDNADEDG